MNTTKVIFRKYQDGEVIAIFPYIETQRGQCMAYIQNVGYTTIDYHYILEITKLAEIEDYLLLLRHLEKLGYKLKVVTKICKS